MTSIPKTTPMFTSNICALNSSNLNPKQKKIDIQSTFIQNSHPSRRVGRAVECTGLENRQGFIPFQGSNP